MVFVGLLMNLDLMKIIWYLVTDKRNIILEHGFEGIIADIGGFGLMLGRFLLTVHCHFAITMRIQVLNGQRYQGEILIYYSN